MELFHNPKFILGASMVLLGISLDRIALGRLSTRDSGRRFWLRVYIGSDLLIVLGILVAFVDPHS